MRKYLTRQEADAGDAAAFDGGWRVVRASGLLRQGRAALGGACLGWAAILGLLAAAQAQPVGEIATAKTGGEPPSAPARSGDEPCLLANAARTALQTAEHGLELMANLEKMIDERVAASRDAFKECERREDCRISPRLRALEDAFAQADDQKRRVAALHAESARRKAELKARLDTFDLQATTGRCPAGEER